MYGTNSCHFCNAQKKLFGYEAFAKIKFVDCNKESNVCGLEGIGKFPTRVFTNGSKVEGVQSFESLAKSAGCGYSGDDK